MRLSYGQVRDYYPMDGVTITTSLPQMVSSKNG
ncbi:MAG: hypothetical protein IPL22_08105 [Bacteroidetes bacterium]|nr:hypothetical protein [Bacteroidota bacterium]